MIFLIRDINERYKKFEDTVKKEGIYTKPAYCEGCEKFREIHLHQRHNSRYNIAKRCCKI